MLFDSDYDESDRTLQKTRIPKVAFSKTGFESGSDKKNNLQHCQDRMYTIRYMVELVSNSVGKLSFPFATK